MERPILAARPSNGGRKNCHSTHSIWRFHFGHLAFPIFCRVSAYARETDARFPIIRLGQGPKKFPRWRSLTVL
jgi:hypothetical protein